ncbi:hypothetical protein M8818_003979 [Zalaria obscura]|uniref:Uncharacterized protein n=1 Tax=Zalaria obscura TaxID=2024903 RepID=A0ACC3SDW5_9PEZI
MEDAMQRDVIRVFKTLVKATVLDGQLCPYGIRQTVAYKDQVDLFGDAKLWIPSPARVREHTSLLGTLRLSHFTGAHAKCIVHYAVIHNPMPGSEDIDGGSSAAKWPCIEPECWESCRWRV